MSEDQGCSNGLFSIGPPRADDHENVIEGHGVLIAPAHPPARATKARARARRGAPTSSRLEQFRGWPVEFDHLLMSSPDEKKPNTLVEEARSESNSSVEAETSPPLSSQSPNSKDRKQGQVEAGEEYDDETVSTQGSTLPYPPVAARSRAIAIEQGNGNNDPTPSADHAHQPVLMIANSSMAIVEASTLATASTTNSASAMTRVHITIATTTTQLPRRQPSTMTQAPLILFDSKSHGPNVKMTYRSGAPEPFAEQRIPHPATTSTISTTSPILASTTTTYIRNAEASTDTSELAEDGVATSDPQRVEETSVSINKNGRSVEGEFRRAPSRISFESADDALRIHTQNTTPSPTPRPTTLRTSSPRTSPSTISTATSPRGSPLFYVIKDPREQRRQRLIELRRRIFPEQFITTTTSIPTTPMDHFDEKFTLPRIADKLTTYSLTNGAKITSYAWIGIYDQCQRKHTPLVILRDIDPPREERILPLSGWSHNVTSFRLHILNCNTILVPGFSYDPMDGTRSISTYFFVGIGHFPDRIERQFKATVVGSRRDEPLRAYKSEDVLLRLPKGYRTFDVDFISVYNTAEEKSYGHVTLPSLLVPPCTED